MTQSLRFLLGDELREIEHIDPTKTVLQWLREDAALTGTKEGCAEGDCGACTVVLGRLDGQGRMQYRAVNACILFMPMLDGCQLLTVEHVAAPDGRLHPVQQAMVDANASQCGFCTPGFVMSLLSYYLGGEPVSRRRINEALAGNLCRCTGYRPIVDAALAMHDDPDWQDPTRAAAKHTAERLRVLRREDTLALVGAGRRYFAPVDLLGLQLLLGEHPEATLLAGGTDVGLWVTKQHRDLGTVIHLGDVAELQGIEEGAAEITIGAMVAQTDALPVLERHYPDLGALLRRFGSPLIRNSATVGGNIANGSPIGDSMPALIALGARVDLIGPGGSRTMALHELYIDYGQQARAADEIVARVRVPKLVDDAVYRCYKISKRFDQDISAVCAAFWLRLDEQGQIIEARIGLGGVAAIPSRAPVTEAVLVDQPWNAQTAARAEAALVEEFSPLTDMRAGEAYRRRVTGRLLHKFFIETTDPAARTRVLAEELPA